jgi:hypothetical protein
LSASDKPTVAYSLDRILWLTVGLIATPLVFGGVVALVQGLVYQWIGLPIGVPLLLVSILALIRKWGPVLPCLFFGMLGLEVFTDKNTHTHLESVARDIGVPLIGAIIGTAIGIAVEWSRLPQSDHEPDADSPPQQ